MSIRGSFAALAVVGALFLAPLGAAAQSLPSLPTIGIGGGSQTTAVIVACAPGVVPGGGSGTPSGNCSCSETGGGSVSCSCSSQSAGATAATNGVAGLVVTAVSASAGFDDDRLQAINAAPTCADALVELASSPRSFGTTSSGECQFSADGQGVWYSCVY